ncbi:glycosyltransferase family 2 protein [Cellulophaga baltica]|uniref:glycosyltransferase family 2 protein n=1 Tax=Cellulophaga TaxID=104264 RepID=UPI001C06995F|nr:MULTISPECIES: glycosyltransferase family 2 protein [Cellulophaga]MBU2996401.1 glycosyltransferase family 2 protein [Cellulophaga baltica]MDO6767797.1 glycosyltransferase family 2 protein [Cellulophaga sp. 1_MG-2023]
MSKIAIVILNWNGEKLLEQFLPSVQEYSTNATIYVADNASTDKSIQFIQDNYPEIKIVQNTENGGYAKGYNDALIHIEADVYCLLNSDVEVTPNWLAPIEQIYIDNRDVAIIQPKILDYKQKNYFEYAGAAGGFIDQLGYPFCRGRIFQDLEEDLGQYNDVKEIFWATGACMFIKSEVFHKLNGFDEDYFAHQEEVDLCWRAHNKGYKILYVGTSAIYHLGGSTLSNMNPKKTFLNFRNSLFSIIKNLPKRKAFVIIFLRLLLDGVAGIRFIFQGKQKHCWAILKAHISFYKNFIKMLKKRENVTYFKKYYATKSIVWSHFVYSVRKFTILVKD